MDDRKGEQTPAPASEALNPLLSIFLLCFSLWASSLWLAGCAAPGEPQERKPPVPTAIADLAAQQLGNDVTLPFTLPKQTVDLRPLNHAPAIEVYCKFESVPGTTPPATTTASELILTITPV